MLPNNGHGSNGNAHSLRGTRATLRILYMYQVHEVVRLELRVAPHHDASFTKASFEENGAYSAASDCTAPDLNSAEWAVPTTRSE
ncbi:uncharacterized protein IUM83_12373 [Phytophthora cinnamomi]|uniref:uncharacterized protein n=1 Tax=Phytophthora cinnamomi TaxID=4785 RepID=UPI00355A7AAF|nr:hypothetical protein IUM83_19482 [Phytophthora cinnamomi]KAG6623024.1 hypothetical protein IUM83_12373 [Phytophthora cinnamomi]